MGAPDKNLSTEHQPKGSAGNPSDTLDRKNEHIDPGQRQWNEDSSDTPDTLQNASVRRGGEAAGGVAPHPGDPTSPAEADARAAARDRAQAQRGLGDDGAHPTYRS
jgi:hypothetical protein